MTERHKRPTLAEAKGLGCPSDRGRFLRIHDVIATTGLSRTTIYRLIAQREFPDPKRLTARCVGWWEADVVGWIEDRPAAAA